MNLEYIFLISFIILDTIHNSYGARILGAITVASYSHQIFFQPIWRELALRGHQVVVLTTHPTYENLTNLKEVDMSAACKIMELANREIIAIGDNTIKSIKRIGDLYHELAEFELALPEVQELIKNPKEHFDLVMVEEAYPTFIAMKHRFNCSLIVITSFDGLAFTHGHMGNPTHSSLYRSNLDIGSERTFKNRLVSFLLEQFMVLIFHIFQAKIKEMNLKYYGEGYLEPLKTDIDMYFVNNNPMYSDIRPLTPSTISIAGGLHMKPLKELPEDLKDFMDGSPQGVIYFSLGSNVRNSDLPKTIRNVIMETFSELPYNILWKFEADELPGKPDNVKIVKWAPQQDILRHENMKLFITQGGLQSLEEALYSHVPLIAIPFMGDQKSNAAKVEFKKLGLKLNYRTLTVYELKASIQEVIKNPIYKRNIKALALQIQDQSMSALERAVWWTEYILRHKSGEHLKGPQIPFYQYYYFDVLVVLSIYLTLVVVMFCFIYKFVNNVLAKCNVKIKKT